jgi:RimJ/RimL family protein N-acetyltransferase
MTPIALTGKFVRLEPMAEPHRDGLFAAAQDDRIWAVTLRSGFGEHFDHWFRESSTTETRWAYAVVAAGRVVGSSSFLDLSFAHRRVEIGNTWFHPAVWGTAVNVECKRLMLAHAFEALALTRVQFSVDAVNRRSLRAVEKLGALREGQLRRNAITYDGRVRDTVIASILADEWPVVRDRLDARLAAG